MVSGYDKTPPDHSQQPHRLGLPLVGHRCDCCDYCSYHRALDAVNVAVLCRDEIIVRGKRSGKLTCLFRGTSTWQRSLYLPAAKPQAGSSRCRSPAAVKRDQRSPPAAGLCEKEASMVRNGNHAVLAVLALSALVIVLVYAASLPVTEQDGSIDPKESVVAPE